MNTSASETEPESSQPPLPPARDKLLFTPGPLTTSLSVKQALLAEGLRTGFQLGFRTIEASWILEDNLAVQRLIELFGGKPYKTYRIYERALWPHSPQAKKD